MDIQTTPIDGLLVLTPKVFRDERGYFFESFNQKNYQDAGIITNFVQDNQSLSTYGTLRGLHFQKGDAAQAKLVRVLKGEVLDVAVDIRPNSKTFGQHLSLILSEENHKQLFIPKGFAHGFIVLSPTAEFFYKCDNFYSPSQEGGILYNDPELKIDWMVPLIKIILSPRDAKNLTLKESIK
jgi:dTDP-4-dehydrorhamnose 3,5-epimerase